MAIEGADATEAVQVWDGLAGVLAVSAALAQQSLPGLHPSRSAVVLAGGEAVGEVGEVDPGVLEALEIDERVAWLELDLDRLLDAPRQDRDYAGEPVPLERHRPGVRHPGLVPAALVESILRQAGGELLVDLELFDVYRDEQLGEDRRSVAYTLRFQAHDRTLTDDEVAEVRQRSIDAVTRAHRGAEGLSRPTST